MPCYDGRENERQVLVDYEDREKLRREWFHNSPIAELLCSVMKEVPPFVRDSLLLDNTKLAHWWHDHKERDRKKAASAKPKVVGPKRKRTVR